MIFIWAVDEGYYIGNLNPDANTEYEQVLKESIFVAVKKPYLPETEAGIARNVLRNAGAEVTLL